MNYFSSKRKKPTLSKITNYSDSEDDDQAPKIKKIPKKNFQPKKLLTNYSDGESSDGEFDQEKFKRNKVRNQMRNWSFGVGMQVISFF